MIPKLENLKKQTAKMQQEILDILPERPIIPEQTKQFQTIAKK